MSEPATTPDDVDPQTLSTAIFEEAERVLIGSDDTLEFLTIALLTRGHVLIEGVPGVAKTTMANVFARASGLEHTRIQMTPDILPADVTGTSVYRESMGEFELQRGPIFTNLVVVDEINRSTPKTQSALLEAMQERRVTIEGETLGLPSPFMVVATQNPIEMEGVFSLPEAQRDRFMFKLSVDIPDRADERAIVDRFDATPDLDPEAIETVVRPSEIAAARTIAAETYLSDPVKSYILDLVAASRDHPDVTYGGSPRATLAFVDGAKTRAALHGREYVIPEDVNALAEPVLAHRLVMATDAELSGVDPAGVVDEIVATVTPPDLGGDGFAADEE